VFSVVVVVVVELVFYVVVVFTVCSGRTIIHSGIPSVLHDSTVVIIAYIVFAA
jgi:hypothetical protein